MVETAYALEGIHYAYPGSASPFCLELDSLRIGAGDMLALVGPNGAGKTTLLLILALLVRPPQGRLAFFGGDPWSGDDSVLLARRSAVLLTHHPYLFKGTVFDNVAFGLKVRGIPEKEWPARIRPALSLVELSGSEKKSAVGLSAGQVQRVALARALALQPRVLLLDEPTANIEAGLALRVEAIIREICHESGTTIVFSTHNFSQASRLGDEVIYLSDGKRVPFSHENCFSGTAQTDGRRSWIEPRPGTRIIFAGARTGHVTCVINPEKIRLLAADDDAAGEGPNAFKGRVTRLELTEGDRALVRVSCGLTFRVTVPLSEIEAQAVSLSRPVLIKFDPEAVDLIGSEPEPIEKTHD
jgi:tungstate transport system ATP-binding protein